MAGYFRLKNFSRVFLAASVCTTKKRCARQAYERDPSYIQEDANVLSDTTPVDFTVRQWMFPSLNRFLEKYMLDNGIQGLSVAVSKSGQLKYVFGKGIQDSNLDIEATSDTVSSIACISKIFLTYMLLKLRENFQISFDANMQDYIDNFPLSKVAIRILPESNVLKAKNRQDPDHPVFHPGHYDSTAYEYDSLAEREAVENEDTIFYAEDDTQYPQNINNLLYEKSGLKPHHLWSEKAPQSYKGTLSQYVHELAGYPNLLDPGECRQYGDVSYEFLAYLIEAVTGRDYRDVVHEELLRLGLNDTKILSQEELYLNKSRGSQLKNPVKNATFVDYSSKLGSEGLCSTVKDLDKLFNILFICLATPASRDAALPLSKQSMKDMLKGDRAEPHEKVETSLGPIHRHLGMPPVIVDRKKAGTDGLMPLSIWSQGLAMESSSIVMVTAKADEDMTWFDENDTVGSYVNDSLVDKLVARSNNIQSLPSDVLRTSSRKGRVTTLPLRGPLIPPRILPEKDDGTCRKSPLLSPQPPPPVRQRDIPPIPEGVMHNPERRTVFLQEQIHEPNTLKDLECVYGDEFLLRNSDINFNYRYITVSIICANRDRDLYNLASRISKMFLVEYFDDDLTIDDAV